ncbi:hypothetical protein E2C01_010882 [Portunus trituberculatus]|uniref:Uncharacterized protein n=1 Tax=Portunus trituberculatus TaxID=210409 RepID=A0A5B7D9M8_PORTR|nr:hypothetical protein [Portunus trituberculatus]
MTGTVISRLARLLCPFSLFLFASPSSTRETSSSGLSVTSMLDPALIHAGDKSGNHTETLSARFVDNTFYLSQQKDTVREKSVFARANVVFLQLRKATIGQDLPSPQKHLQESGPMRAPARVHPMQYIAQ